MIKCCFMVYRRADLSFEEFAEYWAGIHSRIAIETAPAMGMVRYVQNHARTHVLAEGFRSMRGSQLADFDGMAEAWWENWEALETAAGSLPQDIAKLIIGDEMKFVDMKRSLIFFAEELQFWPVVEAHA